MLEHLRVPLDDGEWLPEVVRDDTQVLLLALERSLELRRTFGHALLQVGVELAYLLGCLSLLGYVPQKA
jgi:hypothetical protein